MVKLLIGGVLHLLADIRISRDRGMALVQALGRDLPGMIDTHQTCRMGLFFVSEVGFGYADSRTFARRTACRRGDRA